MTLKTPDKSGVQLQHSTTLFYHPDYTVGFGIPPNQSLARVTGYTVGRESHPAPKIQLDYVGYYNLLYADMQEVFLEIMHRNFT